MISKEARAELREQLSDEVPDKLWPDLPDHVIALLDALDAADARTAELETKLKPASPAPLSAWRPLKEAPRDKAIIIRDGHRRLLAGTLPDAPHEGAEFAPIADTYELDRAVQVKIAEAFGALLDGIVIAHSCVESLSDPHVTLGAKLRKDLLWAAERGPRKALEKFATILHGAMGGRIPDEVPK